MKEYLAHYNGDGINPLNPPGPRYVYSFEKRFFAEDDKKALITATKYLLQFEEDFLLDNLSIVRLLEVRDVSLKSGIKSLLDR